jgi:hypothetical protein
MTIPKMARNVAEMVRQIIPTHRFRMSAEEQRLAILLRGNQELLDAIKGVLNARIQGRALTAEPSDPVACKSMIARDRELQGFIARLDFMFHSPINSPAERDREQPE